MNDYILIQGDVDCGVALCNRQDGTVYANESTSPALLVNGQGSYIGGCRGAIVRESSAAAFWVFVQDNPGTSDLFLTRIMITPPANGGSTPSFSTQAVTLAGLHNFARQSAQRLPDGTIIFAAGLSVYRFLPGSGTATAIFTAPGGDPTFGNGEALRLSNNANGQVLAYTPSHIYKLAAATGVQIASWAVTAFGLTAATLAQLSWDGVRTAWCIAGGGATGNVNSLDLRAVTHTALTTGTNYSGYTMALNAVAGCLGLVLFNSGTITTVPIAGGAVSTGTLPAGSTGALAVDEEGYFWTADNFTTDIATPTWKVDPFTLTVALTIGARNFGSVPAGDVPRAQDFGFVLPAITIGHGANLNAYDNGSPIAPAFPPGNGTLITAAGLASVNAWCRANGISVALCQDSQRTVKDMLDELLTVANHAPVYSGDHVELIGYDEVSAVGGGAIYTAPTAAGPIADLTDQDFVSDGKTPPVKGGRKRRASCDNVVAIEHIDRALDYAHNVTSAPAQMQIALYGPRKGGTLDATELGLNIPSGSKAMLSIHSAAVAQAIASVLVKRGATGANEYSFTLKARWMGLEAMDLVTVSDSRVGLMKVPVRITSVKETPQRTLQCTAERFIYGLNHPDVKNTTTASGTLVLANVDPGLVNTPIIFEPPAGMLPAGAGPQVWMVVSGADPNYGGCIATAAVDFGAPGGPTYNPLGNIGPCTTGDLTATFASHADPDTVDTLAIDLTESNGSIATQSQQIADGFADPCFVESASGFEVVCPTVATLTSAEHYSLATYIRRGVGGTTIASHASGKRFAVLDGQVFKIDLPPQWVGKTIHLKFQARNKLGGQINDLSRCVDYTFTPVGVFLPGGFYVNGS